MRASAVYTSGNRFRLVIQRSSPFSVFYQAPWPFLIGGLNDSLSNDRFVVRTNDVKQAHSLLEVATHCEKKWSDEKWVLFELGAKLEINCRDQSNHELLFTAPYVSKKPEHLAAVFDLMKGSLSTLQEIDTSHRCEL